MTQQDLFDGTPNVPQLDFSKVKSDYDPEYSDNGYYANTHDAQMLRIKDYVSFIHDVIGRGQKRGFKEVLGSLVGQKKANELYFEGVIILNLDREHKIELFKQVSEITVNGKRVTLFFPEQGEDFEIGIRW